MKAEDIEFLKDLQHELLTQENDSQADPRYWSVMERKKVRVPEGWGDICEITDCENARSLEEWVEYVDENIKTDTDDDELIEEWAEIDRTDIDEVMEFLERMYGGTFYQIWSENQNVQSMVTGCFLTKRACKEYIQRYGYNHSEPRTYFRTAYRNHELERLLGILKSINFDDIKVDEG